MIEFLQYNESNLKIICPDFGAEQDISEFFTFFADGYKFQPKFRSGQWDGKIRLFNSRSKTLPKGLLKIAIEFCKDREYDFSIDPQLNPNSNIQPQKIIEFIKSIPVTSNGKSIEVRDYQQEAILKSFHTYRNILISPTSSGKSLMLYYKIRYHIDVLNHNVIIVVPTTQLVEQMLSDFEDYSQHNGWDVEGNCQILYAGKEKVFSKKLMISTWQSLNAMGKSAPGILNDIVKRAEVVCFDETHRYSASVVLDVMGRFTHTKWRTGTTGTLDDSKLNKLQLIGLIGEPYQVITTKTLMDEGSISPLKIKMLLLTYPDHVKKELKGLDYKAEINYLVGNEQRTDFIVNLANACTGNTLILFSFVTRHGSVIYEKLLKKAVPGRLVKFVHGGVDVDEREEIRRIVESETNAIIIATSSIFSTGTNIPSIENIIFAMPTKSSVRVRQSIGRGLRLKSGKSHCTLFDISDDLSWKTYRNTTLKHMQDRVVIYDKESFDYQLIRTQIPGMVYQLTA
jgi:superfamily II DNA or RNA helicase